MKNARHRLVLVCGVVLALAAGVVAVEAQEQVTFSGVVARMSGPLAGTTDRLQITINNWTTPDQRQALLTALADGGQEQLLTAMEKIEVGFARFPDTTGWRLRYAWSFEVEGTRVVRIATDRPIWFVEVADQLRTLDYPFGIIELRLDQDGKGEGEVFSAASVKFNQDGVLEVESYGTGPQRLLSVTTSR